MTFKIVHEGDYRAARAAAYPNIGDQLDAVLKGFKALQEQGINFPDETAAWMAQLAAVKDGIPKP